MDNSPNFYLEAIVKDKNDLADFEGPLSLILMLLQKNKIEIRDIKIADILDQYLEYLNRMQQLDLEVASEFVRMAAYLLYLKTKTLLVNDEEEVSELDVLIETLEQLKARDMLSAVKERSPMLMDAYNIGALFISKSPEQLPSEAHEYQYRHEPIDLLYALYSAVRESNEKTIPDLAELRGSIPTKITYSVAMKSQQILKRLKLRNIGLNELYSECNSKSEIVATFISVLELCSMGSVFISVARNGIGYEISFAGGDVDEILEEIERDY